MRLLKFSSWSLLLLQVVVEPAFAEPWGVLLLIAQWSQRHHCRFSHQVWRKPARVLLQEKKLPFCLSDAVPCRWVLCFCCKIWGSGCSRHSFCKPCMWSSGHLKMLISSARERATKLAPQICCDSCNDVVCPSVNGAEAPGGRNLSTTSTHFSYYHSSHRSNTVRWIFNRMCIGGQTCNGVIDRNG